MVHIIARFKTTTAANQAICDGLVIAGKRVGQAATKGAQKVLEMPGTQC